MIIGDDISSPGVHEESRPVSETYLDSEDRMSGALEERGLQ